MKLTISRTRRARVAQVILAAFAVLASGLVVANEPLSATANDPDVGPSDPYTVPQVVDVNPDPDIVETTIVAREATVDIGGGQEATVNTFNGTLPGPQFRLEVGDRVIVHFENELPEETGIHWHGIELANASDGTPLTQNQVPEGESFLYVWEATRPGVYWYHPHHHHSTNQVFKGLYGTIIVTDPNEAELVDADVLPPPEDTTTLTLSDITVCEDADEPDSNQPYDPSLPHVSGAEPLPLQPRPHPADLCETPMDDDGIPISPAEPLEEGEVPNIQVHPEDHELPPECQVPEPPQGCPFDGKRVNEGHTVLTNGVNVGHRDGGPTTGFFESQGDLDPDAFTLPVEAGQGVRLQILNTAAVRYMRLVLTVDVVVGTIPAVIQIPLVRVGGEGGLLDHARREGGRPDDQGFDWKYDRGEILLPPGARADVVAQIPDNAVVDGVATMWTQDVQRAGIGFTNTPTVPVAHLEVTGTAAEPSAPVVDGTELRAFTGELVESLGEVPDDEVSRLLDPQAEASGGDFATEKAGLKRDDFTILEDIWLTAVAGAELGINDEHGSHSPAGDYTDYGLGGATRWAELGDVIELSVTNMTSAHHPFHAHGSSIQPISIHPLDADGGPSYTFEHHEFVDNIDVPARTTLLYRFRAEDRPLMDGVTPGGGTGRWVFHCHIFFHAVFGMISEYVVVAPDADGNVTGNEKPFVNTDDTVVEVKRGETATLTGTYSDPDGDDVTFTEVETEFGSVTDNGDGTWSWSYEDAQPDATGLLYVTVTDTHGNRGQVAFQLTVNDPPEIVGRIAFRAGANIWTMNPDGTNRQNLTNGAFGTINRWPVWSPDGSQLAFHSNRDGAVDLWVMDADGTNPRNLTNGRELLQGRATWSPDGSQLAFGSQRGVGFNIFVMDADGNNVRPLTDGVVNYHPSWSPDGSRIVFQRDGAGHRDIWVMDADGTNQRNLTDTPDAIDSYPSWSPDGSRIVFHSDRDGDADSIDVFVMDLNVRFAQNVTRSPDSRDLHPAWSPDGEQLTFVSNRAGPNRSDVWVTDADGTDVQQLGPGGDQTWQSRPHLPGAAIASEYEVNLPVTGGVAPYSMEVTAGTLPAGLELSPEGTISGTPTGPTGTETFTVTVTDSRRPAQTGSRELSITVDRGRTELAVDPVLVQGALRLGVVSARLVGGDRGAPLAGATLAVRPRGGGRPSTVCTMTTNHNGSAQCTLSVLDTLQVILAGGVTVTYAGSPTWHPVTTQAGLS